MSMSSTLQTKPFGLSFPFFRVFPKSDDYLKLEGIKRIAGGRLRCFGMLDVKRDSSKISRGRILGRTGGDVCGAIIISGVFFSDPPICDQIRKTFTRSRSTDFWWTLAAKLRLPVQKGIKTLVLKETNDPYFPFTLDLFNSRAIIKALKGSGSSRNMILSKIWRRCNFRLRPLGWRKLEKFSILRLCVILDVHFSDYFSLSSTNLYINSKLFLRLCVLEAPLMLQ